MRRVCAVLEWYGGDVNIIMHLPVTYAKEKGGL